MSQHIEVLMRVVLQLRKVSYSNLCVLSSMFSSSKTGIISEALDAEID